MNEWSAQSVPKIPDDVEADTRKRREASIQQEAAALAKQAQLGAQVATVNIASLGLKDLPRDMPAELAMVGKKALTIEADDSASGLDLDQSGKD